MHGHAGYVRPYGPTAGLCAATARPSLHCQAMKRAPVQERLGASACFKPSESKIGRVVKAQAIPDAISDMKEGTAANKIAQDPYRGKRSRTRPCPVKA
jgi:hypothetical protein